MNNIAINLEKKTRIKWSFIWFISEHKVCLLRIWLAHELKQNLGFLSQSSISKAKNLLKNVDYIGFVSVSSYD
jgi:hypothetical protein